MIYEADTKCICWQMKEFDGIKIRGATINIRKTRINRRYNFNCLQVGKHQYQIKRLHGNS